MFLLSPRAGVRWRDAHPRRDRARPDAAVLAGRGAAHLRPRHRARRPSTPLPAVDRTTGRRPASTCPARRGGRSSARSGCSRCSSGLVFGGWLLAAGVIALIATLVGWLADAVEEYRRTVEADTTGHLESGQPPRDAVAPADRADRPDRRGGGPPVGRLRDRPASGGDPATPGASGAPALRRRGAGRVGGRRHRAVPPPASGAGRGRDRHRPRASPSSRRRWTAPAGKPFTLAFANEDPGTPHNIELKDASGAVGLQGRRLQRRRDPVYDVPALPAGEYTFVCTVHPSMTGTATLQ